MKQRNHTRNKIWTNDSQKIALREVGMWLPLGVVHKLRLQILPILDHPPSSDYIGWHLDYLILLQSPSMY